MILQFPISVACIRSLSMPGMQFLNFLLRSSVDLKMVEISFLLWEMKKIVKRLSGSVLFGKRKLPFLRIQIVSLMLLSLPPLLKQKGVRGAHGKILDILVRTDTKL